MQLWDNASDVISEVEVIFIMNDWMNWNFSFLVKLNKSEEHLAM